MTPSVSFNLVNEPCIPLLAQGRPVEVSLVEALTRAHEYAWSGVQEPLQAVAVMRQLLLPVVWSAIGVPRDEAEWARWWEAGRLDGDRIAAYLTDHHGNFDLFHPERPFAQVASLRTGTGATKPVSLLLAEQPSGNNVPLWGARTEDDPPALTPAAAARALLAAHCWDTAAIKSGALDDPALRAGKTTGNPVGPVGELGVVVPVGPTLFATILLNSPIIRQGLHPSDRPQWSAEPATSAWSHRPALGLVDLMTWQSRRVRLIPDTDETGGTVVRRVVLTAGDRLSVLPEQEPHTAWQRVDKPRPGQPPRRPIRHQPGRAPWRGMTALLATTTSSGPEVTTTALLQQLENLQAIGRVPTDLPLQVLTVGVVYGQKQAVVDDAIVDTLPLPVAALSPDSQVRQLLLDVAEQADLLRMAINILGDGLRRAAGVVEDPKRPSVRIHRLQPGEMLMADLDPVVRRLLRGLQRQPDRVDEAEHAWKNVARRIALAAAETAYAAAPPTAFLGRLDRAAPRGAEPRMHRLSTAEARYRATLTKILGPSPAEPLLDPGAA